MEDERTAQEQITKDWQHYASADKTDCVDMNRTGGAPSYVELLTCLEVNLRCCVDALVRLRPVFLITRQYASQIAKVWNPSSV
jgi:hypothetical protein